jgi:hypothetical protein
MLRQVEEGAMRVKLQKTGICAEAIMAMTNVRDECPEQLLGSVPGSLIPQGQKPAETVSDKEYAKVMEERYGICAEGFF